MIAFKNILVPVDFSEPSDRALEVAIDLAKQYDASLTVLHVFDVPLAYAGMFVRITPAWAKRASTQTSRLARAAEWLAAARVPAAERPDFMATMGFLRATSGAIRENLRGFPKLSRYSAITFVTSSFAQYEMRSLLDTSALLPTDTNPARPMFSRAA